MRTKLPLWGTILFLVVACAGNRRAVALWSAHDLESTPSTVEGVLPKQYSLFQFNINLLKEGLQDVGNSEDESILVQLPDPNGDIGPFKIWQAQVVSAKLLKKYPSLANYKGFRTSDVSTKIRLELPPSGLQVMVSGVGETWYISPYNAEKNIYMLYYKSDLEKDNTFWEGKMNKN